MLHTMIFEMQISHLRSQNIGFDLIQMYVCVCVFVCSDFDIASRKIYVLCESFMTCHFDETATFNTTFNHYQRDDTH